MLRVPEPEVMDDPEQALAYDAADFSGSHNRRVDVFRQLAPPSAQEGRFLDLGCGSGDLDFRLLAALPGCLITAVDGSQAMVRLGVQAARRRPEFEGRISFIESFIPSEALPRDDYATIMSHSFLHHLHEPMVLWETIKELAAQKSFIFVSDLRRPESAEQAQKIVDTLAGGRRRCCDEISTTPFSRLLRCRRSRASSLKPESKASRCGRLMIFT